MENDSALLVIDAISSSRFHEVTMKGRGILSSSSSSSLKRKRPPKIHIPNVLREISADIFKGKKDDGGVCFSASGISVFSIKGKKKFMEDSYKIFHSSNGSSKDFYGVYDGHGGSKAAEFVAEKLHLNILEMLETSSGKDKEKAIKEGYLKTDEEFLKQGLGSGACCVTALIQGREMVVSNLGDCRAVLCRDGIAEAVTTDHKPEREDERRRIEDKGGFLEIHRGSWRVQGTLAVSRSIGDGHLKDWVMAEPDTKVMSLTNDMEYLVLASDGLWDEVSNQEAVDIVMQSCSTSKKLKGSVHRCTSVSPASQSPRSKRVFHSSGEDENECPTSRVVLNNENDGVFGEKSSNAGLLGACKELVSLAVGRGSLDDITVMIVDLSRYNVKHHI